MGTGGRKEGRGDQSTSSLLNVSCSSSPSVSSVSLHGTGGGGKLGISQDPGHSNGQTEA